MVFRNCDYFFNLCENRLNTLSSPAILYLNLFLFFSDIFIPAAFEKSINSNNADKFQCKLIVEPANGPTTQAAGKILLSKGVKFLPDVLCNAGGVTVSYFEWLKNLDHVRPGRLSRKWEEKSKKNLIDVILKAAGV